MFKRFATRPVQGELDLYLPLSSEVAKTAFTVEEWRLAKALAEQEERMGLTVVSPPKSSAASWDPKVADRIAQEMADSVNQTVLAEQEADRKAGRTLIS
jgi:hypothetical protein